jgi:hypothetical protein
LDGPVEGGSDFQVDQGMGVDGKKDGACAQGQDQKGGDGA